MRMLDEKVVLVTGAGRGIGRAVAKLVAAQGAKVVVNDLGGDAGGGGHDVGPGQAVVDEIIADGGEAVLNTDSVVDWDAAHGMVQQAVDRFGRIDAVVNNAGILRDRIFHKMSEEEWDVVVNVHLKGSFNVARAAAGHFRGQSRGSYVHMTSTSGIVGNFGQANYGAAKLGIFALSKCIALDMARYGVRSNCVAPFAWSRLIGTIPTNDPEQEARVEKMKRMTPETIAPIVAYLCSDAAEEVTGQVFGVRQNELFLFSHPRPKRTVQRTDGWTPETIAEHAIPAMQPSFASLDRSGDVFSWDPI